MTVRIDELTTDVTVEDEPAGARTAGTPPAHWERAAALRALHERALRDEERTRAEGYGD